MTLESKLKEIKERAEKATAGPWYIDLVTSKMDMVGSKSGLRCRIEHDGEMETDADFIAHARQDVPMLLEVVEELLFIFDKETADCNCDIDYCCPLHRIEQIMEKHHGK